jgi:hypothetical protein
MSEIESRNWWAKSSREIDEQNRVSKVTSCRLRTRLWREYKRVWSLVRIRGVSGSNLVSWAKCSREKSFANKAASHHEGTCSGRRCRSSTFFDGGLRTRAYDDGVSVCRTRRWYCGVGGWVLLNEKKLFNTVDWVLVLPQWARDRDY